MESQGALLGDETEPIEEWAKPIIAGGPRTGFEMEQVLPGQDPDDPFANPISESNDPKYAGERAAAHKILMELCQADLRCLDAHAHLGNLVFDHSPREAVRHYEVGVRIGELSLGTGFASVLLWGDVDNRPFLRCMHGYGLCLWRLGRYEETWCVFEKSCGSTRSMRGSKMNLRALQDTPPWDWPEGTGKALLDILRTDRPPESDLLVATELAGDFTVVNDELVDALLSILRSDNSEPVRGRAAISLGPVLEHVDCERLEDADDLPIAERTFQQIQESLRSLYMDAKVPKEVRRRILEASVRAPQDWHRDAVRAAYSSDDEAWRHTAVFCMRFVGEFEEQILEALDSKNPSIHCEAVLAAGNWAVDAAWPHVAALVTSGETDKQLLLAAIDAAANIRPHEAAAILDDLADSDDEDIVAAVDEAMAMAEGAAGADDDFDDDDDPLH